ncbi:MAG: DUF2269 family protein [Gaiellaceae bacterium]
METTHAEAPAQGSASTKITVAIGLAVAAVGLIFALNTTDAPSHWFSVFKLIHVSVAVFWVGGGIMLTVLALWAQTKDDPEELATIARQAAFAGERFFAPAGLLVLAMGITMVINDHIGFGTTWVIIGLVGYATTFTTGIAVLSPRAKRVAELLETKGAAAT